MREPAIPHPAYLTFLYLIFLILYNFDHCRSQLLVLSDIDALGYRCSQAPDLLAGAPNLLVRI